MDQWVPLCIYHSVRSIRLSLGISMLITNSFEANKWKLDPKLRVEFKILGALHREWDWGCCYCIDVSRKPATFLLSDHPFLCQSIKTWEHIVSENKSPHLVRNFICQKTQKTSAVQSNNTTVSLDILMSPRSKGWAAAAATSLF